MISELDSWEVAMDLCMFCTEFLLRKSTLNMSYIMLHPIVDLHSWSQLWKCFSFWDSQIIQNRVCGFGFFCCFFGWVFFSSLSLSYFFLNLSHLWTYFCLLIFGTWNRNSCLVCMSDLDIALKFYGSLKLSFCLWWSAFLQLVWEKRIKVAPCEHFILFVLWLARKSFQEKIIPVCFKTDF